MTSPLYFRIWERCCTIGLRVVSYYIQHRQESIERHLLSPSDLGLLHLVASPLSILDDHPGDYDKEKPSRLQTLSRGAPGMGRGPYSVGPRIKNLTKKLRTNGDNTKRPLNQRYYEGLNSSLSESGQHKTTQDTQATTRTCKHPDSEKRNGPPESGIFLFRTSEGEGVLVGALERVSCGTSLGPKRS